MKYYMPRDIGCNRDPVYDKDGNYITSKVRDGFYFEDEKEIYEHPMNQQFDELEIRGDAVFNGLLVGFIKDKKPV